MLYRIGVLELDTFPFEVGGADIETTADYAKHALASGRKDAEPIGPGDDSMTLTGQLMPFHIGGLTELEIAKQMCTSLTPQFVMRGDGRVAGWYILEKVKEQHSSISPNGPGFVVKYTLELERIDDPGSEIGSDLIMNLLSLFG